jgi:hypothetical protein
VIKMRVEDYYTQGRRGWVRLHEKGGKRHEMPCNHNRRCRAIDVENPVLAIFCSVSY